MSKVLQCPRCGSLQVETHKRGYNFSRGLAGSMLLNNIVGWMAGMIGKNDEIAKCRKCGYQFKVK